MFLQFGVNDSDTLPVKDYFGLGLTGFGLVPLRPDDSVGVGMAESWLNPHLFKRPSELMFQGYYQAHIYAGAFFQPAISYIPTPGPAQVSGTPWQLRSGLHYCFEKVGMSWSSALAALVF